MVVLSHTSHHTFLHSFSLHFLHSSLILLPRALSGRGRRSRPRTLVEPVTPTESGGARTGSCLSRVLWPAFTFKFYCAEGSRKWWRNREVGVGGGEDLNTVRAESSQRWKVYQAKLFLLIAGYLISFMGGWLNRLSTQPPTPPPSQSFFFFLLFQGASHLFLCHFHP